MSIKGQSIGDTHGLVIQMPPSRGSGIKRSCLWGMAVVWWCAVDWAGLSLGVYMWRACPVSSKWTSCRVWSTEGTAEGSGTTNNAAPSHVILQ